MVPPMAKVTNCHIWIAKRHFNEINFVAGVYKTGVCRYIKT